MRLSPLWLFPLFILGGTTTAQPRIAHYPPGHDLAYGTVQALTMTTDGYLWLGGQTSLRRYDGTQLDFFGNRREDTTDLANDYIEMLYEDPAGVLWIGQQRGLSRLNSRLEQFANFRPPVIPDKDAGRQLVVNGAYRAGPSDNTLWVASGGGLFPFAIDRGEFIKDTAFLKRQRELKLGLVHTFIGREEQGDILLATDAGLARLAPAKRQLALLGEIGPISHMVQASNGDLIINQATVLTRYRLTSKGLQLIHSLELPISTKQRFGVTAFLEDGAGTLYVGSTFGLFRIDWREPTAPTLFHFTHDQEDPNSLVSNSVMSLARSHDDILLIGTRKGIERIPLQPNPIQVIKRVPGKVDLCDNITKGSAVDVGHNLLLLGTQGGLSIIDLVTNEVRCYTPESLPGLRKKYIFNVDPGPRPHTFWVGYRQGGANLLVLEDPEAPYFEEPNFSPYELGTEALYQTTEDTEGTQWLATSNGLYAYSPQDQTTKAFLPVTGDSLSLSTNRLFSVLHDRKGRLWVGTRNGGLCVRQTTDGKTSFRCFRYDENDPGSLPSDMVLHVNEDAQGRIWISNPEALAVYLEDGTFRTFGLADGLPYTICYGTFEDQQGNFWAAFGGNFAQIELTDAGDFKLRKVITRNEGLAGQANAQYGWSSLPDGRLALSQRDGLNIFLPSEVGEDNYFPPIILTEFELFDHPVGTSPSPQDKVAPQFLLEDDINRLQKINLPAGQDFISLTFSAPEYRPNRTTFYSYRIAGIQDEWTDTNGRNYLSFPKLPPGDYLLELRTGDERERWSEEVRTLGISLAAPWYQRWWALLLFGLAGAGAVYLLGRQRERQRQRVEAARVAERENFRRRSARDFHDEAGNHLSRVSLLTALAQRQVADHQSEANEAQPQVQTLLQDINSNVQVVREGMRDFIWALDPDNDNAYELGLRLKRFGQELFTHHHADFSTALLSPALRNISLRPDQRRHLVLLFKEAMHNSFKHATDATEVSFSLHADAHTLTAEWRDNGQGFSPQAKADGAGLKNMRARANKIDAQLALNSQEGTLVEVSISTKRGMASE